ncbi:MULTISPECIES: hypothetical protein [Paenibacillus]|uniref:hypothetical protein n=1 Tax=Paenibacillus TaxID=44249 RepID=UPI00096E6FEA|nr:hypothetical protein [Paenibacillus odorifer]OMD87521.1 hypothetical protein BSK53_00505 [Paenibacillus odorifer]
MSYIYDTQVIYHNLREDQMTHFTWNGEKFYRTLKGKPKKENSEGKRVLIAEEEFQKTQQDYNFAFGMKLDI